jgi:hypothetical protein
VHGDGRWARAPTEDVEAGSQAGRVEADLAEDARLRELQDAVTVFSGDLDEDHQPFELVEPVPVLTQQPGLGEVEGGALTRPCAACAVDRVVHDLGARVQRGDLPGLQARPLGDRLDLARVLETKGADRSEVLGPARLQVEGRIPEDLVAVELPGGPDPLAERLAEGASPLLRIALHVNPRDHAPGPSVTSSS